MIVIHPMSFALVRSPRVVPVMRRRVVSMLSPASEAIIAQSAVIGKGLTLFVFFSATLNWLYYSNLTRGIKDDEEDNKKE